MLEYGGDEDEAIAALLHGAIEDQRGAATREEIQRRFGDTVVEIELQEFHNTQNNVAGKEFGAIFDAGGRYRYALWRAWSADYPRIAFIMLNPSTADEQRNDPTIRRCIGFARAWQFGSLEVVNLFAYRVTNARELLKVDDPVGEENNRFLIQAIEQCSTVVVGWGTRGALLGRDRQVMELLACRENVYCLGLTKNGQPRHPLYVKGDTDLVLFRVRM